MQSADVVQAIFRALGIDGWETIGLEPAEIAFLARTDDFPRGSDAPEMLRSPIGYRGIARHSSEMLVGVAGDLLDPSDADETMGVESARFAGERAG